MNMREKIARAPTLRQIILGAIIDTAERSPLRRGPYVFDEAELQRQAAGARAMLTAARSEP